jgi:hypothetical protein
MITCKEIILHARIVYSAVLTRLCIGSENIYIMQQTNKHKSIEYVLSYVTIHFLRIGRFCDHR